MYDSNGIKHLLRGLFMYRREKQSWLKHLDFTLFDILAYQLAFVITYYLRHKTGLPYADEWYKRLAAIIVLFQICVTFFYEPYKDILRRNKFEELKKVIITCALTSVGAILFVYGFKLGEVFSRYVLFGSFLVNVPISYIFHILWKKFVRMRVVEERERSVMLLLTNDADVENVIREFERNRYRNFLIRGIVLLDSNRAGEVVRDVPIVANLDNLMDYVRRNVVDEIFINSDNVAMSQRLADELLEMGVTVHIKLIHDSELMTSQMIERCGDFYVLTSSMNITNHRDFAFKRLLDIIGSIFGLIFMLIALLIFGPIIKKQSPGPIFFKQIRVGKNGRRFKLYKFRSMYVDAEARKAELMEKNEMQGNIFKITDDPRIIPIGKFMRKYSIDELPQFINILKGDMSLVGTRPPTEDEFKEYAAHHRARLGIKPGLTGMWQVSGRNDVKDFEDIVALDTKYITNWSLGLDIKILFKTVAVVFKGSGAS